MLNQQQLQNHKKYITGSKVASILNLPGAYQSKYELFAEMKGYAESNIEESENMEAGSCMELGIAEWCRRKYGWKLIDGPGDGKFHKEYPFLFGLVDRLLVENCDVIAVAEFKNQDKFALKYWEEGPPEIYKAQCYFYSQLWDIPTHIVACFGGNHFEKYELPRNPKIESFILKKCCEFWDDLQHDKWPNPDNSESCTETLKKLYGRPVEEMISGMEDQLQIAIHYQEASEKVKKAEEEKALYANQLREAIKNNSGLIFSDGSKVTWKKTVPKKMVLNEVQFEKEYPDLYRRFCYMPEGYRQLRVTLKKEKFS